MKRRSNVEKNFFEKKTCEVQALSNVKGALFLYLHVAEKFCNSVFNLDESGLYTIKVQAVNYMNVLGEVAYVHNVSIDGSHDLVTQSRYSVAILVTYSANLVLQSSDVTTKTKKVTKPGNQTVIFTLNEDIKPRSQTGVIAGGVIGAVVFLCLVVFICVFLLRRIRRKRRMESVKVNLFFFSYTSAFNE